MQRFTTLLPLDRMYGAWSNEAIVGGAGSFPFDLTVPGGALPTVGVTVVGVLPTHRRQGVLRAMMRAQLDDAHEHGEPLAALWASEESIYGRFGYGLASFCGEITLAHEHTAFAHPFEPQGTLRLIEPEEAQEKSPAGLRPHPARVARHVHAEHGVVGEPRDLTTPRNAATARARSGGSRTNARGRSRAMPYTGTSLASRQAQQRPTESKQQDIATYCSAAYQSLRCRQANHASGLVQHPVQKYSAFVLTQITA